MSQLKYGNPFHTVSVIPDMGMFLLCPQIHTSGCVASVFWLTSNVKQPNAVKTSGSIFYMQHQRVKDYSGKPIKPAPGLPNLPVGHSRYPTTDNLPLNAEARMTSAVRFASHIGAPIQTLLTINAAHLQRIGSDSVFGIGNLWDGFRDFDQLLRKWVTGRGITWSCIWVREGTGGRNNHIGEHWHIALHLPPRHRAALASQVAIWTGEGIGDPDGKRKCIARSETGAWYLNTCKGNAGEYLGKATPPTRLRYGRSVPNHQRKSTFRYKGTGLIEGKRFNVSRPIGHAAQREHGWNG